MIATIPEGVCGIDGEPSQSILAGIDFESITKLVGSPLNFAGGLSLDSDTLKSKPAVLVPALRDFGQNLQATVDQLHQIQKVSQAFRVVISTDMPIFKSLRPYNWAVTHLQSEIQWDSENGSWKKYVENELSGVVRDFGVRLVFDFSSRITLRDSWNKLLAIVGLSESPDLSDLFVGTTTEHYSWRGWLGEVSPGYSQHVIELDENVRWTVALNKVAGSSMLFVSDDSPAARKLANFAGQREWNIALLTDESKKPSLAHRDTALLHVFDGLSLAGAGLVGGMNFVQEKRMSLDATLFANEISELDFDRAERKALAFWSSRM
ncbi:hypothetical protein [Glutamicibacter sp. NPDC090743]|uniref:hypothetical protein n=1 Tax=Glutamicibacter sp. NPDC090743 TaxID=3364001 RepID=UPI003805287F